MIARPEPRGELSALLVESLGPDVAELPSPPAAIGADDPLADEDLQLALYLAYELHYRGLPGAHPEWEWEPSLLRLRRVLEELMLDALAAEVGPPAPPPAPEDMDLAIRAVADAEEGPSLSRYVESEATADEVREFMVHRSAYQLKEAGPHSWALPRLSGPPKAALVEIQADEYGGGHAERVHAHLFAEAMDAVGLDATYGAYLDHIPAVTLCTVNLMSLFGLHRRLRGALVGHLALFETTSSVPNGRYANGLRRLGYGDRATAFFDEHVEADAVHEAVATVDLAGGLAKQDPALAPDIMWGAQALSLVEARWSRSLLDAWGRSESSLRVPLHAPVPA